MDATQAKVSICTDTPPDTYSHTVGPVGNLADAPWQSRARFFIGRVPSERWATGSVLCDEFPSHEAFGTFETGKDEAGRVRGVR